MRRFLIAIAVLALLGCGLLALDAARFLTTAVAIDKPVRAIIPPGMGFRQVVDKLANAGVFDRRRAREYFIAYAWWQGATAEVKSGEYQIRPAATPRALLAQLVAGRTVRHALTIIEGWTFAELRAAVAAADAIRHTLAGADNAAVMAAIGAPGQHPEGRFLPDTYFFPRGTTDVAFLRRAYEAMARTLETQWGAREKGLALDSRYEALILASIVEKETAVPEERARVAGVFLRRLRLGMRLQTDPTVIYGLEEFDGNLRRADLLADGPYNTYTRPGLPPTPIALPGAAAIHASLHPAEGDALYFVARGDGSHAFSATYAEHKKAVHEYQLTP